MFMIRRAKIEDADTLLKLARMVHFINLPPDKSIIQQKITQSRRSFLRAAQGAYGAETPAHASGGGLSTALLSTDLFMFVLEDVEHQSCIGSSQLVARMGGPHRPNVRFKLEKKEFFSQDLQTGTSHIVAHLDLD